MEKAAGRPLIPAHPWPSSWQRNAAVVRMIAVVATIQFVLGGLDHVFSGRAMAFAWWAAGAFVLLATFRIEGYLARKRRMGD